MILSLGARVRIARDRLGKLVAEIYPARAKLNNHPQTGSVLWMLFATEMWSKDAAAGTNGGGHHVLGLVIVSPVPPLEFGS